MGRTMKTTKLKQFKLNKLAAIVTASTLSPLLLTAAPSALAEEQSAKENVEVIEVRGIRRSLEASMNTKRFARWYC